MSAKLLVGLDGTGSGDRALSFAKQLAKRIGSCEIVVAYVIEWSPFTFQTPEENAQRHKRREEELKTARERILDPAVSSLKEDGFSAIGVVRHGDVAETLDDLAIENGPPNRSSSRGAPKAGFPSACLAVPPATSSCTRACP